MEHHLVSISRLDLGSISARSRLDLGSISRLDLGSISPSWCIISAGRPASEGGGAQVDAAEQHEAVCEASEKAEQEEPTCAEYADIGAGRRCCAAYSEHRVQTTERNTIQDYVFSV